MISVASVPRRRLSRALLNILKRAALHNREAFNCLFLIIYPLDGSILLTFSGLILYCAHHSIQSPQDESASGKGFENWSFVET